MDKTISEPTRALRQAFGAFATGVTVITALRADSSPAGITVNSFSSLSLDPPMVLWSLMASSPNRPVFELASHFAVSILAHDQEHISKRFAGNGGAPQAAQAALTRQQNKFDGIALDKHVSGIPLIHGAAAQFVCKRHAQYPGGDHLIFVGEVEWHHRSHAVPLLFHAGHYKKLEA